VAGEKEAIIAVRAEEIMSTDLYTAKPNDRVVDALRKMGDKQVRRIPVINDGGRLLGMISMADIARETEEDRELGQTLEEISQESSFWRRIFS
jgi:predicted transcriptional regulator